MSNIETPIRASFRVARAVYFTNLTDAKAAIIPLGVFAEIIVPGLHGLALKARSKLTAKETGLVGGLLRDRLSEPFGFLREEFQTAWARTEQGGEAISFMNNRHSSALSVLAPRDYKRDRGWMGFMKADDASVELKLSEAIDHEFEELLREHGDGAAPKRKLIEVDDERIAA